MASRTAIYGASAKMMYVIVSKLRAAGAVSPDEAAIDRELFWQPFCGAI